MKLEFQSQYRTLEHNFKNIRDIFSGDDTSIHKARNELKIIELNGLKTVVKSFKIPHLLNRIVYTYFRSSKASKSYFNAIKLKQLQISTPEPIGYAEFYSSNMLKNSYFITLHCPFDFTIREALHHKVNNYQDILRQFAAYTYDLHQKGVWHLDYSPGNILIQQISEGYLFNIVDINRMDFRTITPLQGCENFNKLWASDEELEIIGSEYARLCSEDPSIIISEMQRHNNSNKRIKNFKKYLKKWLKGDFSPLS
jgi:hypothetical protein